MPEFFLELQLPLEAQFQKNHPTREHSRQNTNLDTYNDDTRDSVVSGEILLLPTPGEAKHVHNYII